MNIDDLKLFLEIAQKGGFAAVARARNVDPSAISRAIAGLESDVGVRLFQRSTRKLSLTEAGEKLLARVRATLDELDSACEEARSVVKGPSGTLRITASNAFGPTCIAPVLPQFQQLYPGLRLELVLNDDNLDLIAERIDMAVRLGAAQDQRLVGVKVFETHYRVCASREYLNRAAGLKDPADLSTHRCLLFPFGDFRHKWTFKINKRSETVAVDGDLITTSALTLRRCALGGMGPALLPSWLVDDDIAAGNLVSVFPEHRITATSFDTAAWILYPSRNHVPSKVKAMAQFLRTTLARYAPHENRR